MGGRVIVIGGGIAGAASAYWLAREHDVLLLERSVVLGAHSSGRSAAIHRAAVDDVVTRALARETYRWHRTPRTEEELTRDYLDTIGLVIAEGASESSPAPKWAAELTACGEAERLDADELRRIAPLFRPRGARSWWLPNAGRVGATALVHDLIRAATRRGLEVRTNSSVKRILVDQEAVSGVELHDGTHIAADTVVLAAGAWSASLGAAVGCAAPSHPSTRHLFVTHPLDVQGETRRTPVMWDDEAGFYTRSYDGGLLLCACDQAPATPDDLAPRYGTDPAMTERVYALATELLALESPPEVTRSWCGLRDQMPDDRPLLGPDARLPGLAWCAGFGGHGFSIGVAAGRALADLVAGRDAGLPGEAGPARFQRSPRSNAAPRKHVRALHSVFHSI